MPYLSAVKTSRKQQKSSNLIELMRALFWAQFPEYRGIYLPQISQKGKEYFLVVRRITKFPTLSPDSQKFQPFGTIPKPDISTSKIVIGSLGTKSKELLSRFKFLLANVPSKIKQAKWV